MNEKRLKDENFIQSIVIFPNNLELPYSNLHIKHDHNILAS